MQSLNTNSYDSINNSGSSQVILPSLLLCFTAAVGVGIGFLSHQYLVSNNINHDMKIERTNVEEIKVKDQGKKILFGIVGGLGPKATSHFFDDNIVEGRTRIFKVLLESVTKDILSSNTSSNAEQATEFKKRLVNNGLEALRSISTANWSQNEIKELLFLDDVKNGNNNITINIKEKLGDQDHIPILIFNNPEIPPRPLYILKKSTVDPVPELTRTSKSLILAGANRLCMVCNTAHYFLEDIKRNLINDPDIASQFPINTEYFVKNNLFLDMLEETLKFIARKYANEDNKANVNSNEPDLIKIGLLATRATLETKIYEKYCEKVDFKSIKISILSPLTIEDGNQENIELSIFGRKGIKTGFDTIINENSIESIENLKLILIEANKLRKAGAHAIVLGCTELPLLISKRNCSEFGIDKERGLPKEDVDRIEFIDPGQVVADEILRSTLNGRRQ